MKVERSEQQAAKVRATERAMDRLEAVDKPWEGWRLQLRLARGGGGGEAVADLEGAVVARGAPSAWGRSTSTCAAATGRGHGPERRRQEHAARRPARPAAPRRGAARLGPSVVVGEIGQERTAMLGAPRLIDAFTERAAA